MLRERYPGVRFEVVNTAMTAINSHVVRAIARECAAYEPDLFIVYMGNNEVTGPYGAGTVFGNYGPNLTLIRAGVWTRTTRLGQLLGGLTETLPADPHAPRRWEGMAMFTANQVPADDPRLAEVYAHFAANLADILDAATDAGARAIVCTVVTNLKDCPPFASVHRPDLADADRARWQALYDAGVALEDAGRHAEAVAAYRRAEAIDDAHADLHFRLGRCGLALGQSAEAVGHFTRARDLDALRFRADTRINATIREVASARKDGGVILVDAEDVFAAATPGGMPGGEWLYEHVHFNPAGNYRLARAVLDRVAALLPKEIRDRAPADAPVPRLQQCQDALVLTPWNACQVARSIEDIMRRPPFTNQIGHAARQAARRRELRALKAGLTAEAARATAAAYRRALDRHGDDHFLRVSFAAFLRNTGNAPEAVRQWRLLRERFPGHPSTIATLGVTLLWAKQPEEAAALFREALRLDPKHATAHRCLGDALVVMKRPAEALDCYGEALRLRPDYADAHNNLAAALNALGRRDEAVVHFEEAVRIEPGAVGHCNLANVLARLGRTREAVDHLRRALAMDPENPDVVEKIRRRLRSFGVSDDSGRP